MDSLIADKPVDASNLGFVYSFSFQFRRELSFTQKFFWLTDFYPGSQPASSSRNEDQPVFRQRGYSSDYSNKMRTLALRSRPPPPPPPPRVPVAFGFGPEDLSEVNNVTRAAVHLQRRG
ncbi:unnamed protein product [Pleuronectes platessa]|uniref:Uncharacterized protein n=1 Tax=Pleuronectes platessa TaxID=8262 RepID=A0A9N7YZ52_PLEPL|nr:unnamed protein product [Pleuronectes platessa]